MKGSTVGDIMIRDQDSGQCNSIGLYTAYGDQFMIGSCHTISVVHQDHQQHRAAGVLPPATDEDDGQHHDHEQGADLRDDLPVIESRQELDRTRPSLDVRVGHARVDVDPRRRRRTTRGSRATRTAKSTRPQFGPVALRARWIGLCAQAVWIPAWSSISLPLRSDRPDAS